MLFILCVDPIIYFSWIVTLALYLKSHCCTHDHVGFILYSQSFIVWHFTFSSVCLFGFFFFFGLFVFWLPVQCVGSWYPDHGWNLDPLKWKHRVLTTGPLGTLHVIHFLVVFVKCVQSMSRFITCGCLVVTVSFAEKDYLGCSMLPLLSKINWLNLHGSISGLSTMFHWSICKFFCQYHTVLITIAF